jgi:hypothetical protein
MTGGTNTASSGWGEAPLAILRDWLRREYLSAIVNTPGLSFS